MRGNKPEMVADMPETVADIPEMSADLNERPKVEGRGGMGSTFRRKPALGVMLCLFAGGLSACQDAPSEQDQAVSYPSLHTVPSAPRPSTSVEERRQIVQDLIKERNDSLRQTGVVRHRSGLDYSLPETRTGTRRRSFQKRRIKTVIPSG